MQNLLIVVGIALLAWIFSQDMPDSSDWKEAIQAGAFAVPVGIVIYMVLERYNGRD